jgi:hypothetical protein
VISWSNDDCRWIWLRQLLFDPLQLHLEGDLNHLILELSPNFRLLEPPFPRNEMVETKNKTWSDDYSLSNMCNITYVKVTKKIYFFIKINNYLLKFYIFNIKYTSSDVNLLF